MKIIKNDKSDLLVKRVSKTIRNEAKKNNGVDFLAYY